MDFLTELAARNLKRPLATPASATAPSPTPLVQPRLPSRFETPQPHGALWATEDAEVEREDRPEDTRRTTQPDAAPAQPRQPIAPNAETAESGRPSPRPTTEPVAPAVQIIERIIHERATATVRVVAEPAETAPPERHRMDVTPAAVQRDADTRPEMRDEQTTERAARQSTLSPVTIHPQPADQMKPSPMAETPATPEPEPPAIHITIGRLEVRAAPDAAKAPRRESAARGNVASLEDILRERDGGGR